MVNMFAGPSAMPVGQDELGRTIYRASNGQLFVDEGDYGSEGPGSIQRAYEAITSGNVEMPSGRDILGMARQLATGVMEGAWRGLSAPSRALRGEPISLEDVWATAGMAGLGAAPMRSPKGSLRTGSILSEKQKIEVPGDDIELDDIAGDIFGTSFDSLDDAKKDTVMSAHNEYSIEQVEKWLSNNPGISSYLNESGDIDDVWDINTLADKIKQLNKKIEDGQIDPVENLGMNVADISGDGIGDPVTGNDKNNITSGLRTGKEQAEWIAEQLKQGDARSLTDKDFEALGPNGNMRLMELYESGDTGLNMPMDAQSRADRAIDQGYRGFSKREAEKEALKVAEIYGLDTSTQEGRNKALGIYAESQFQNSAYDYPTRDRISYHSTNRDFQAFNNDFFGSQTDAGWFGLGHYTSDNVDVSQEYINVDNPGGNVIPLTSRAKLKPVLEGPEVVPANKIKQQAAEMIYGENVSYDRLSEDKKGVVDLWIKNKDNHIESSFGNLVGSMNHTRRASEEGYDGYNLSSGVERVHFRPEQLRSRFARFDPRLSHLANLSAGFAGGAYLGDEILRFGGLGNDEEY